MLLRTRSTSIPLRRMAICWLSLSALTVQEPPSHGRQDGRSRPTGSLLAAVTSPKFDTKSHPQRQVAFQSRQTTVKKVSSVHGELQPVRIQERQRSRKQLETAALLIHRT